MALPWVRLDTAMPDHPKVIELCDRGDAGMAAAFVWVCSLAYSNKHGTDGHVPRGALGRLNGKAKHAALLVEARLWEEAEKGWRIHGWEEYQRMATDFDEMFPPAARSNGGKARAASMSADERSASAKRAADARWHGGDAY